MRLLANHDKVSKGPPRGEPRLYFAHPAGQIILGLALDVIPQLFVELRILALAHKQRAQPHGNCVQPVHPVHAQTSFSRTTPEMAVEIRSQLAASRSRCRLPSRVSE